MGFVVGSAHQLANVSDSLLQTRLLGGIEAVRQGAQCQVGNQYGGSDECAVQQIAEPADSADCGGTPDGRGGIQSPDCAPIFEDDTRAQEPDSRDDVRD